MKKKLLTLALLGAVGLTSCNSSLKKPLKNFTGTRTGMIKQRSKADVTSDYPDAVDELFIFDVKVEAADSVITKVEWNTENPELHYIKTYWTDEEKSEVEELLPAVFTQFENVSFSDFYLELVGDKTDVNPGHDVYFTTPQFSGATNKSRFNQMRRLPYTGALIETGIILGIYEAITA